MTTGTSKKIELFIRKYKRVTAKELIGYLGISPQAVFRQLARLQQKKIIYKIGKPPKVYYLVQKCLPELEDRGRLDPRIRKVIENNYLIISPSGERKEGLDGFKYWCDKTKQPFEKTADEYVKTLRKYGVYKKKGLINGIRKLRATFARVYLERLYYLDFYSIERFGKTKLGQLLLYAKQSQDVKLIKELVDQIRPFIESLIKKEKIDYIGFIPPTVKREVQLMKELEKKLRLNKQRIDIVKIKTDVAVAQKTLSKLEDRVENAQKTIIVEMHHSFRNILLIDDAVGSGATLNETAAQIKASGICEGKIIGLAITGSFKGFDVISEV